MLNSTQMQHEYHRKKLQSSNELLSLHVTQMQVHQIREFGHKIFLIKFCQFLQKLLP